MLPKKRRTTKLAFKDILTRSAYGTSPLFSIRWSKVYTTKTETKLKPSIFGVVISKKVLALATDRNKLKRRMYHALRELAPNVIDSYNIVFFLKKGAEELSLKELSENIRAALAKNRLVR